VKPMRLSIALVALLLIPATAAKADYYRRYHHHDGRYGVYVPPPVYYPPPQYYHPPRHFTSTCYAGPVACPLYSPRPVGAPCHCRHGPGAYYGRAG